MYEKHYGKGMEKSKDDDMVLPGSPDARRRKAYSSDMYDGMKGKWGQPKNKTASGPMEGSLQGSGGGTVTKEATYGKKKSYKSSYSGAAGKTSKGKSMEHKVERHRTKES